MTSRIVVYGMTDASEGEIRGNCSRGWTINDYGEASTVTLSALAAGQAFLQFGRLVLVEHLKLPAWAGMIAPPWDALPPASMTVLDALCLFNLRTPDEKLTVRGSTADIVEQLLAAAQEQGPLPLRMGETDEDPEREEKFDQRPIWELVKETVTNAGMEMRLRPELEGGKLRLYLDVRKRMGVDTGFLLHDGMGANCTFTRAVVDGGIWNRVIGIGDQMDAQARTGTEPHEDTDLADTYRLRSVVVQFSGDIGAAHLDRNAEQALQDLKAPKVILDATVMDVGNAFQNMDLGNQVLVRASRLLLPGGNPRLDRRGAHPGDGL